MKAQIPRGGCIVHVTHSLLLADGRGTKLAAHAAVKQAVTDLSRSMASDLGGRASGVRCRQVDCQDFERASEAETREAAEAVLSIAGLYPLSRNAHEKQIQDPEGSRARGGM